MQILIAITPEHKHKYCIVLNLFPKRIFVFSVFLFIENILIFIFDIYMRSFFSFQKKQSSLSLNIAKDNSKRK